MLVIVPCYAFRSSFILRSMPKILKRVGGKPGNWRAEEIKVMESNFYEI
jgi:hypothetical protein